MKKIKRQIPVKLLNEKLVRYDGEIIIDVFTSGLGVYCGTFVASKDLSVMFIKRKEKRKK